MIPKKIHYCWVGGNPLPESAKKCISSWRRYCPDYEIIEWNESNYDFTKNQYMRESFEAKKWAFATDYARLDIIYQYGGIYLDTDVEIIKSFNPLLKNKGFAGFEDSEFVNSGQGFGAEAGNPVIKKLLESYDDLIFKSKDGSLNMIASPELNTEVLSDLGLIGNGKEQVFLALDHGNNDVCRPTVGVGLFLSASFAIFIRLILVLAFIAKDMGKYRILTEK